MSNVKSEEFIYSKEVTDADLSGYWLNEWNYLSGDVGFFTDLYIEGYIVEEFERIDEYLINRDYVEIEDWNVEDSKIIDIDTGEFVRDCTQEELELISEFTEECFKESIVEELLDKHKKER